MSSATLLQRLARGGWSAANIVVIDPHGEYASALGPDAMVSSVLVSGDARLRVPYWALPAGDIMRVFAGSSGGATTRSRFDELVAQGRRHFAAAATWLMLDPAAVTADTPIPFDLRPIRHQLDWENNETRMTARDPSTFCERSPGDAGYLSEAAVAMTRTAANRIAREGRKYGVGLLLITQRPSELPDTALAQCGSLIALRLTNSADQAKIRAALPDSVSGLAAVLPSLRTGEAVVTGEALALPARVLVDIPNPLPAAEDPSLTSWRQPATLPDLALAIAAWRGAYSSQS